MYVEEEEDDADPEWVDFDPKKDKNAFVGRAIPDEIALREEFEQTMVRRDLYRPRADPDKEDKFDEMISEQMKALEKERAEAPFESGGYSDIDVRYA